MRFVQIVCLGFILHFAALLAIAQPAAQPVADEAIKEKQRRFALLMDQVLAELPNLRLAENRAFLNARIGSILWESDQRRARVLFNDAVTELLNAQQEAAQTKKNQYQNELLNGQGIRHQILNTIAVRDAEFALEALYKTRPAAVADALAFQAEKNTKISQYSNGQNYVAQSERQLEQSLLRQAADQNPERAARLLKESLKKGLSYETYNLLNKLHEKEPETAKQLAAEIIDKMIASGFMTGNQPDQNALNLANSFLSNFANQREPNRHLVALDPNQLRKLAEILIAFYLDPVRQQQYGYNSGSLTQIAEKLVPGALERIHQVQQENRRRGYVDESYEEINKLLSADSTAEQLVAAARRYPVNSRGRIYEAAASKYAAQGNVAGAMQLLENNFSDVALDQARNNLNTHLFNLLQSQGKFADAEAMIDELPEPNRLYALIGLANAAFSRNREGDRAYAAALLAKARSYIPDRPENANEMSQLLQIVSAYAQMDTDEAIRIFSGTIPQFNELADAAIMLYAFQGNSSIRQGETILSHGNSYGIHFDQGLIVRFAEKDFDRAMSLIDSFSRREMRILLKLYLAENAGYRNLQVADLPISKRSRSGPGDK